jgi:hypothetical protein
MFRESIMKSFIALTLLAVAGLAACSSVPPSERNAQALMQYAQYAGEPIHDFHYYSHYQSWQPLSRDKLFTRTGANDAYLLTVFPCMNLEFATRIGITSQFNAVRSGFDSVLADGERCTIQEIRPVNYKQLRADLRQEKQRG